MLQTFRVLSWTLFWKLREYVAHFTYTKHCFGHFQHMLPIQFAHTKHSLCMMSIKRVAEMIYNNLTKPPIFRNKNI